LVVKIYFNFKERESKCLIKISQTKNYNVLIVVKASFLVLKIKNFMHKKDIPPQKDALLAEQTEKQMIHAAAEAEAAVTAAEANLSSVLFVRLAVSKQPFLLNQEVTDLFTVPIVTETANKDRTLAKNNQKKEKAERNKLNAKKFKKRTTSNRFGSNRG